MCVVAFNRSGSAALLLLVSAMLGHTGCNRSSASLSISPATIDLGKVAASGQHLSGEVRLANVGPDSVAVRLRSSCSCITSDPREFSLSPGQRRDVEFSIASSGRSGEFQGEIVIVASDQPHRVPVKATLIPEVTCFPNRAVLLPDDEGGLSAEVLVEAPLELWPDLTLVAMDERLVVVALDPEADSERRFQVRAARSNPQYEALVLKKSGQETPVLQVPVIVGCP